MEVSNEIIGEKPKNATRLYAKSKEQEECQKDSESKQVAFEEYGW